MASRLTNNRFIRKFRKQSRSFQLRAGAIAVTLTAATVLGTVGFATSGAYFSDTKSGAINGTIGSVRVTTTGGTGTDGMNFAFDNMLPGEPQTATVDYQNTGTGKEDIYLTFPNLTALSAINDLGHYGEVTVTRGSTVLFHSTNMSDHAGSCGPFGSTNDACWPLPAKLKVDDNVNPHDGGVINFTFDYTSKLSTQAPAGTTVPFNAYPAADGQTTIRAIDGTGSGLPWNVVAVQHNQQP